ncbi:3-isopropylmalate dehydratase small subunit [Desulfobulbus oligotrophicus]|jgi:3-isopropylmalate/(R)-2-methylmalate dehydratase small subunit|uniref:3-isopropylmalate dehydratase n=1 Tax=Desulfobulbus oligotrophicus TaxID=1909699 RepID=A0A7T5VFB0_9BACT|nr:3-isopropylmalate dehydratase small subunit [Desulfobulbus oligotrophicus]MDY0389867.1 3-isopropylmalate dehydratase small subunit [Desulfobulbus oligotrophicus]QQG66868.1 3-isopropylmalate dehydratase small subunit [Desulfobulbus oligotrophicus]
MKQFGGPAAFIDRDDVNTDEIIPAKYLTEITKKALAPHLLEDLYLEGRKFDPHSQEMQEARVLITRSNFGCGSSREHAVWALEVNDINVVIGESFARIFRQNMFNCGILAVELSKEDINRLFALQGKVTVAVDLEEEKLTATSSTGESVTCEFTLNPFDKKLIGAGGWLAFADANY